MTLKCKIQLTLKSDRTLSSVLLVKVADTLLNKSDWSKQLMRMLFKQKNLMLVKTGGSRSGISAPKRLETL